MLAWFLACALSLPSPHFNRPSIVSYHLAKSEQKQLKDWIHKNNPGCEVFIHPNPQTDKLKNYGWERFPANWNGHQIWIRRKPHSDRPVKSSA